MHNMATTTLLAACALAWACGGEARRKETGQKTVPLASPPAVDLVATPDTVERVSPEIVRQRVMSGKALLVYSYDNDENFKLSKLEGAIPLSKFKALLTTLPQDQEIYFYCG